MAGEMCWFSPLGRNEEKILHLRIHSGQPWRPYTACPEYAVPDYQIPNGSRGWATAQKLLREGWKVIPSAAVTPAFAATQRCKSA